MSANVNPAPTPLPKAKAGADYVTRIFDCVADLSAQDWAGLLSQAHPSGETISPFIGHAYLKALQQSGCASAATGWHTHWLTLWANARLVAAAPLYAKDHSRGEYVFDHAWARAYAAHGLSYYPKGVIALPFTPVPGGRLLTVDAPSRVALIAALQQHAQAQHWSSLHALMLRADEAQTAQQAGWSVRTSVQFHWQNRGWPSFDAFLAELQRDKRKNIVHERRKVNAAGVHFDVRQGCQITAQDWDLFYRCYQTTYLEHGNLPYLNREFFARVAQDMPENWLMFIARDAQGQAMAASLLGLSSDGRVAYGRYWGALAHLPCLHFEACYYQPIEWCIAHGVQRFEGGAQGEHKMARALMPTPTHSAHWLAHPGFAQAVDDFCAREGHAVDDYRSQLALRSPFK